MVDLKSVIETAKKEGHMIRAAPFSFLTVCAVAVGLFWWGFSSQYSGKLKSANNTADGWKNSSEMWQSESNYWKNQADKKNPPYAVVPGSPTVSGRAEPTKTVQNHLASKILRISFLYHNKKLNGMAIQSDATDPKQLRLSDFQIRLDGNSPAILSVRLYLATALDSGWPWQKTASEEPGFPTAMWMGSPQPVSPTETWNTGELFAASKSDVKYPISAELKVFYGGESPAEAKFTIVKP